MMRIQKYLSDQGLLSRRKAEHYLQKGWIKVNGKVVTELGRKIDPSNDVVTLDPRIERQQARTMLVAFHKPRGIVTNLPKKGETAIKDIIERKYRHLHSIGRLDKESEGLILMTDDGILAKQALSVKPAHLRVYEVDVDSPLHPNMIDDLEQGMVLFGQRTLPCKVTRIRQKTYKFEMREGKNRQIRRMLQKVGRNVIRLKRISFGEVKLGNLPVGAAKILDKSIIGPVKKAK